MSGRFIPALAVLLVAAAAARAQRTTLEKPVPVATVKADKKPLDGRVVAYDDEGFELVQGKNKSVTVRWDDLGAPGLFNVRASILGPKATGEQWLELGRKMLTVEGGGPFAERAFSRALKLSPRLKADIEEAKRAKPGKVGAAQDKGGKNTKVDADDEGAAEEKAGAGNMTGPQVVGRVDASTWGDRSEDEQAAQVVQLKAFAESAGKKLNKKLTLSETKYFLFYSDLAPKDAATWAGLLDRMYARLAELFGVAKDGSGSGAGGAYTNVWYGKALVFVFQKADDYRQFQIRVHQTDPGSSAGMCHCYGDGVVHIAFYRQPDERSFAHVLVHESVHGFIHRFRAPPNVPSWANEGLAEVIAEELVPRPGRSKERESLARQGLQQFGGMGGMFEARHIAPWQYPVAETLCTVMIRQNKRHYVDFIAGIKEGLSWEESLEQRYKAPRDRLVRAFGESMGIKGLKE